MFTKLGSFGEILNFAGAGDSMVGENPRNASRGHRTGR
jgi:hypothetical protein